MGGAVVLIAAKDLNRSNLELLRFADTPMGVWFQASVATQNAHHEAAQERRYSRP